MLNSENNKRIAKNTILLYSRLLITMFVSLYTSRVIINVLGIEDFGIYNIVGGVIVLFSFVNGALVSSTQRFLNYEIGKENINAQKKIFQTSLTIYLLFCLIIIVLAETIGLWFVNTQLNIPPHRMITANWVYQFSLITFCLNILRVPYNATVIAFERMSFYAYLSILEVILKLLILLPLTLDRYDNLKLYSIFIALISFVILFFYKIFCNKKFNICKFGIVFEHKSYSQLLGFSAWSLFGSAANVAVDQGVNIVFNIFYGVTLNATIGINNQIRNAINSFLTNFQTAFSPQIIKSYASNQNERFQKLILYTSKYSFFLTFILVIPFYFNADFIITKWLINVPDYLIPISKLGSLILIVDSISAPLGISVQATGNLKKYQILYSIISFLMLPIALLFTYLMLEPTYVYIAWFILNILIYIWKIYFVSNLINLSFKLYWSVVLKKVLLLTALTIPIIYIMQVIIPYTGWLRLMVSLSLILCVFCTLIYFVGLNSQERRKLSQFLLDRRNKFKWNKIDI